MADLGGAVPLSEARVEPVSNLAQGPGNVDLFAQSLSAKQMVLACDFTRLLGSESQFLEGTTTRCAASQLTYAAALSGRMLVYETEIPASPTVSWGELSSADVIV